MARPPDSARTQLSRSIIWDERRHGASGALDPFSPLAGRGTDRGSARRPRLHVANEPLAFGEPAGCSLQPLGLAARDDEIGEEGATGQLGARVAGGDGREGAVRAALRIVP